MATINGRRVRFTDEEGIVREGIVSGWREGSAWVKVHADGFTFMRHCSEPLEYVRASDGEAAARKEG